MSQQNIEPHVYTVELIFSGDMLEPLEISNILKLQPTRQLIEYKNSYRQKNRKPFWSYNGRDQIGFQSEWILLEDGLEFLTKTLQSRKKDIIELSHKFNGCFWCGHFQSNFDGGPRISSKLLTEISSYGVSIKIDNYFSE